MKKLLASSVLAASALTAPTAFAEGSLSANVGYMSEYYFRGIYQEESSASAGLDYENSGFYIGTWAADVGDGLEIDGYLGYGMEFGEVSVSVGFTTYQYTGDFDSEYNEFNFNFGWKMLSLEYSVGTQEKDDSLSIAETDYDFIKLTLEHNGFFASFGAFGDDADGEYFEAGYGTEIGGFDASVSVLANSEELGGGDEDEVLLFTLGKSFDL